MSDPSVNCEESYSMVGLADADRRTTVPIETLVGFGLVNEAWVESEPALHADA
jgi:hypothetical protein